MPVSDAVQADADIAQPVERESDVLGEVLTDAERIETNTNAIRSIEHTLAAHGQRLQSLEDRVESLVKSYSRLRESFEHIDERLKHLERMADRTWRLLLIVLATAGALILGLIVQLATQ